MNRIPKAARAKCATAFGDILIKVANEPTNLQSWNALLSFGPTILAKPPRGGTNRNQANVVLKGLAGCNDNPSAVSDARRRNARINTEDQDARLAAAIRNKLEAGNFRSAVRLLCSDDVPAPTNTETLKSLMSKQPPAPADRRPASSL